MNRATIERIVLAWLAVSGAYIAVMVAVAVVMKAMEWMQ